MSYIRFSALILILSVSLISAGNAQTFSHQDCLKSDFDTTISHASFPFGVTQKILFVSKKECVITIHHERMKFLKRQWLIDVCREPVHVKYGIGDVEVLKRNGSCEEKDSSDYCSSVDVLDQLIQDDGLIFASGKRDNLTDDHGKIYCVHQLLLSYLRKGQIQGAVMTIPSTKSEGIHNPESSPSESTQGTPKKYDF